MMITVHHLEHSRSQRIVWLLEELGLEYRIKAYARNAKTQLAPPELADVHPLGKAPVLTDGRQTLAESAVIVEYLARQYGDPGWAPLPDSPRYWAFQYWMHYAESSLMPILLLKLVFEKVKSDAPWPLRPLAAGIAGQVDKAFTNAQIETHFGFVDQHLREHRWLVGRRITIADVQMTFPMEAALARGTIDKRFPAVVEYVERMQARPAYRRALDRGGAYAYGPTPDASH